MMAHRKRIHKLEDEFNSTNGASDEQYNPSESCDSKPVNQVNPAPRHQIMTNHMPQDEFSRASAVSPAVRGTELPRGRGRGRVTVQDTDIKRNLGLKFGGKISITAAEQSPTRHDSPVQVKEEPDEMLEEMEQPVHEEPFLEATEEYEREYYDDATYADAEGHY